MKQIYYKVSLKNGIGYFMSFYEYKKLQKSEYHQKKEWHRVRCHILKVETETFLTKHFRAEIPKLNYDEVAFLSKADSKVDSFDYDEKRKIVFYGYVGLYAIQKKNAFGEEQYYNVVTGKEIPNQVIEGASPIVSSNSYQEMLSDLYLFKNKKKSYETYMDSMIRQMVEINQKREIIKKQVRDKEKNFNDEKQLQYYLAGLDNERPKIKELRREISQVLEEIKYDSKK